MYAKNLFLMAIDNAKWGDDTIDAFNWFFHNLDNHSMWEEGERGERVLLHYASRARTDYDKLALHKAYNIAAINEDLLAKIACELDSREVCANLEQVRLDSRENLYETNLTSSQPARFREFAFHQRCCCCCHRCYHHLRCCFPPMPYMQWCGSLPVQIEQACANRFQPTERG